MPTTSRIAGSLTLALVAILALAGCGGHSDMDADANAEFNNADVTFAQSMIPHHEQAVVMATMATTRAASPEVKELAEQIEAAQAPEIETMSGWLQSWGEDASDSSGHQMDGMAEGETMDHAAMPGMMSDADMTSLGGATGAAFDRMFLTMMVSHHEGAIEMAQAEQQNGKYPEAIRLAEEIEAAQAGEIARMKTLLAS